MTVLNVELALGGRDLSGAGGGTNPKTWLDIFSQRVSIWVNAGEFLSQVCINDENWLNMYFIC